MVWFSRNTDVGYQARLSWFSSSFTFYLAEKGLCVLLVLVWPQIKDSQEVVLSAPPIPLLSSCAFLLQNASCLGLASGTAPKLAPAFKQIHSSFLSAGAEGGGYYPRVEMSSNGRRPRSVCTRIPVTSPSLTSRPGLKLDQLRRLTFP